MLLIVPEQFSFEMEKAVARLVPNGAQQVEVYSFTRLCHKVFADCGGMAGEVVTEPAKQILMSLTLGQVRDQLELYSRQAKNPAFVGTMLRQIDEFKNRPAFCRISCGFFPARPACRSWRRRQRRCPGSTSPIRRCWRASFRTRRTGSCAAVRCWRAGDIFRDCVIFVDSFMTFMAGEKKLLQLMLAECERMEVSLPLDALPEMDDGQPLSDGTFSVARETFLQMLGWAKDQQIPYDCPDPLPQSPRFQNEALRFLEKNVTTISPPAFAGENSGVILTRAANPYEEVRCIAAQIIRLVRREGVRYSQIAVIARDIDPYLTAIEDLFPKYDIPCFFDRREDVQTIPVFSLLFSALDALHTNFDTQHVLALGKNPLMGLAETQVALLENYCFLWGVDHKLWLSEEGFANHPRGLVEDFLEEDRQQLELIRQTAQAIVEPLQQLKESLPDHCTGKQFAQALYTFLLSTGARQRLEQMAHEQTLSAQEQWVLHLNQSAWEVLIDLLDVFAHVLRDIPLPPAQLRELFVMSSLSSDIGSIPNTLDQVSIGSADRMRPNQPKISFVMGLNLGEFPPQLSENGLFSETERDRLQESGIQLNPSVIKLSDYEKYYLYSALSSPSDRLYLSCHSAKLSGEATPDSPVLAKILRMFPSCARSAEELPEEFYIANDQTAFETLCRNIRKDTPFTASLIAYVRQTPYAARLEQVPGDGALRRILHSGPGDFPDAFWQPDAPFPFAGGAVLHLPVCLFLCGRAQPAAASQGGDFSDAVGHHHPLCVAADGLRPRRQGAWRTESGADAAAGAAASTRIFSRARQPRRGAEQALPLPL